MVQDNFVNGDGGGHYQGNYTLLNLTGENVFRGNLARGQGGAIDMENNGTLLATPGTLIVDNTAALSGGGVFFGTHGGGNLSVVGATFANNSVVGFTPRGAALVVVNIVSYIENCTFSGNYLTQFNLLGNSLLSTHTALDYGNGAGAAIFAAGDLSFFFGPAFAFDPALSIVNCEFANNVGVDGSGVYTMGVLELSIFGSYFKRNVATGKGARRELACPRRLRHQRLRSGGAQKPRA